MLHTSAQSLASALSEPGDPFRIVANGTWLNAGRPVTAVQELSVSHIRGIVEYVPGDLTMTVRAGTPHAEIDATTRSEGQWLGIDCAGVATGTIGATIATASVGPLVHGIGAIRDIVLGMEVVSGNGIVTRSGGRVVKNVAGFDLVRMQTGAWGTLGIITEVSLRLRALPEVDETVALELDARTPLLAHLVRYRNLTLAPVAAEIVGAPLASALGIATNMVLLVRLGGNAARVLAQRTQLASMGAVVNCDPTVWHQLSALGTPQNNHAVLRVSHLPSQLALAWSHVHSELSSAALSPVFSRATISRGSLRVVVPQPAELSTETFESALGSIVRTVAPPGGHVVWEQLARTAWENVPSAVGDALSYGLQRTLDPLGRCNPGILGASFVK